MSTYVNVRCFIALLATFVPPIPPLVIPTKKRAARPRGGRGPPRGPPRARPRAHAPADDGVFEGARVGLTPPHLQLNSYHNILPPDNN